MPKDEGGYAYSLPHQEFCMKKLIFALVFLSGCGQVVANTDDGVVYVYDQCYDVAALHVCEPPSMPGACFDAGDGDVVFRPCDHRFGTPSGGGCFTRFLDGVASVTPEEILTCRTCLRRYYPPNQVESYCSIYDFAQD